MRQVTLQALGYSRGQSPLATSQPAKANKKKLVKELSRATQQFLDAGQKVIGPVQCKSCRMFYTPGTEDDEVHGRFCEKAGRAVYAFTVTKGMRTVSEGSEGAIILIDGSDRPCDQKRVAAFWAEAGGCVPDNWTLGAEKAFFMVQNRKVIGFALVEQIEQACLMDDGDEQANPTSPAVCGLICLWASPGLPSTDEVYEQLVCAACNDLVYGYRVPREKVAYYRPSESVKRWATRTELHPLAYWHRG